MTKLKTTKLGSSNQSIKNSSFDVDFASGQVDSNQFVEQSVTTQNLFVTRLPKLIFYVVFIIVLLVNFIAVLAIKQFNINFIPNDRPFGIALSSIWLNLVVVLVLVIVFAAGFLKKFSFATGLILGGVLFNFLERSVDGYVKDYINIGVGAINIADICIWTGLLLLNYQYWFFADVSDKLVESSISNSVNTTKQASQSKIKSLKQEIEEFNNPNAYALNEDGEFDFSRVVVNTNSSVLTLPTKEESEKINRIILSTRTKIPQSIITAESIEQKIKTLNDIKKQEKALEVQKKIEHANQKIAQKQKAYKEELERQAQAARKIELDKKSEELKNSRNILNKATITSKNQKISLKK
jgi:lipoprotein signal peptidase